MDHALLLVCTHHTTPHPSLTHSRHHLCPSTQGLTLTQPPPPPFTAIVPVLQEIGVLRNSSLSAVRSISAKLEEEGFEFLAEARKREEDLDKQLADFKSTLVERRPAFEDAYKRESFKEEVRVLSCQPLLRLHLMTASPITSALCFSLLIFCFCTYPRVPSSHSSKRCGCADGGGGNPRLLRSSFFALTLLSCNSIRSNAPSACTLICASSWTHGATRSATTSQRKRTSPPWRRQRSVYVCACV